MLVYIQGEPITVDGNSDDAVCFCTLSARYVFDRTKCLVSYLIESNTMNQLHKFLRYLVHSDRQPEYSINRSPNRLSVSGL